MNPLIGASLISAGGSLLGGLLGKKSQSDANAQNIALQREFAQNGIRWKVEDAKAAGLHPLYALGGSGAAFTPSVQPVFDGPALGQNLSRAASIALGPDERELRAAQLEQVKAATAKDYALASAAASEASRANQQSGPAWSAADLEWFEAKGMGNPNVAHSFPVASGSLQQTPLPPVPPAYLTADVKPGFQRYNTSVAGEVILPAGGSMSEAVESMENPVIQAWILTENLKHYGPSATKKLKALLGDKYKWWENPGGALADKIGSGVRSFGAARAAQGGNE